MRIIRQTVLVVGEGYAEYHLLRHLRAEYTSGNRGHGLVPRNARGKSAEHVINYTIRICQGADYSAAASLFDTDTGLTPAGRQRAKQNGIVLLRSEPCLEAWLLEVAGRGREATTQEHKRRFREYFNGDADEEGLIASHFSRVLFDAARPRIDVLNQLLAHIGA